MGPPAAENQALRTDSGGSIVSSPLKLQRQLFFQPRVLSLFLLILTTTQPSRKSSAAISIHYGVVERNNLGRGHLWHGHAAITPSIVSASLPFPGSAKTLPEAHLTNPVLPLLEELSPDPTRRSFTLTPMNTTVVQRPLSACKKPMLGPQRLPKHPPLQSSAPP